jgi:DNA polymerase I-like protein with 3'-5' exonuclease and polymerase domains
MQEKSYVLVDSLDKLKAMISEIKSSDLIAFDTETNSLNPRKGKIIGFSISTKPGSGYYLPTMIFKDGELIDNTIESKSCHEIAEKSIKLLIGKKLVMHNGSFDCRFVKSFYGIDLTPSLHVDTVLLVHTVKEEGAGFGSGKPFGLKEIAKMIQKEIGLDVETAANEEQIELKHSIKANGGQITKENYEIWKADIEILSKYAAADTDLTLRIYHHFMEVLKSEDLEQFFFEDEVMPLYREVTIPMEEKGVRLDMDLIKSAKHDIQIEMKSKADAIFKALLSDERVQQWVILKAMETYPPNSKGTFAQRLVEELDLNIPKSEKSGKYSITQANITRLEDSAAKKFLLTGDQNLLDEQVVIKICLNLWKEDNDGKFFNIQSRDHLGEITFGALGIKPISSTAKGKPQFDDNFLESIIEKYEWAKNLQIYNRLLKISSTYVDRFLQGEEDGRYYFYYRQHGTVSGRYGSDAQQLPKVKEEGDDDPIVIKYNNMVRAFFVPDDHNIFIDCDYESLEPHVFAHVSGDDGLKDIFRNNWDFYSTIAIKTEKLNQYSPDKKADNYLRKLAPAIRNKAKAYSLGIPYGMGAYALGKNINVATKEAQKLVDGYLNGFPELKNWMKRSENDARNLGYVKTQVGRIRHLPKVKQIYEALGDAMLDWNTKRQLEYEYGKEKILNLSRDFINGLNNAKNVQIQGLSASIVNRAALAINRELIKRGIRGWVCAQIHDQIIVEVDHDRDKECAQLVKDLMENTTKLSIALKAPPEIAKNWRDGH